MFSDNYPWTQVITIWLIALACLSLLLIPRNATWRQVLRPFRFIGGVAIYLLYGCAVIVGLILVPIVLAWEKSK